MIGTVNNLPISDAGKGTMTSDITSPREDTPWTIRGRGEQERAEIPCLINDPGGGKLPKRKNESETRYSRRTK